ncbi:LURP-one-related/scramblase family protein [Erysipelothrix tonsillarum]|uniref:LURP-one-related/scramblase family protein n=1 Tax=Erysipelothrix tonsillarum TaxID=38402 RepID=UPI000368F72D|nr:LURP-one-related family protein [Erysipelothrix tonsillarum]
MKLYIKQRVFSFRDRFDVKDQHGTTQFQVQGSLLSIGRKFTIYDVSNHPVARVKQKPFRFLSKYILETPDHQAALNQKFTFFKMKFTLHNLDWQLNGNITGHNYTVDSRSHGRIMTLSKKWFSWGDSYELDIHNDTDTLMCLCIAIAVDAELASSRNNQQNNVQNNNQ